MNFKIIIVLIYPHHNKGELFIHTILVFMKLSKSKLDAIYLLSTNTKACLVSTLPNSLIGMDDVTFLYSLRIALEIGSLKVIFFFTSLLIKRVDVSMPTTSPASFFTGN